MFIWNVDALLPSYTNLNQWIFNLYFSQFVPQVVNVSNLTFTMKQVSMSSAADKEMILIWNPELFWVCWNILHIMKTIMDFLESTKFKSSLFFKENCVKIFFVVKNYKFSTSVDVYHIRRSPIL